MTRVYALLQLYLAVHLRDAVLMSNNLLQLFFGWEGVGLVSYLLIGFWYAADRDLRPTKAFLVNRVGDFGFVLGIGIVYLTGSLQYVDVFGRATGSREDVRDPARHGVVGGHDLYLLVFVGAMGKSAQVPLHLAARFHGSDADLRTLIMRPPGDRGHIHGRAHVAAFRAFRDRAQFRARYRRDHGVLHGPAWHRQ
jgi:NADH:ubiquinone oxidoreductase subunit 2 (subunit N)